ncbi:MAG: hypothetical protein R2705_11360 [Ilumatobacteraceae bacterium]
MILDTCTHDATTPAGAVLLDADLAILGADPATYETYVRLVRREYAHLDAAAWRRGRLAVLESFLARPVLFHTAWGRRRDRRARGNLGAERRALQTPDQ